MSQSYDHEILTELDDHISNIMDLLTESDMDDDSANGFRDEIYQYFNQQQLRLGLIIKRLAPEPVEDDSLAEDLRRDFRELLCRFNKDLLDKLLANERKYQFGYSWKESNWEEQLQRDLLQHIEKGDPRDTAIFSLFAWHHQWPTARPLPENGKGEMEYYLCSQAVIDHLLPLEMSSAFKSGYSDEDDTKYYVARLDHTYGDAYYKKVIEPFNKHSNIHIDFWYRSCTPGTMDTETIRLKDCRKYGLFKIIEEETGLTTERNRAMVICNLADEMNCTPVEFINLLNEKDN